MKEEPLSDPEPRFKFNDPSIVKLDDEKPIPKIEKKPALKQEEIPKVKPEEKPVTIVEENVKVKPERTEREVKTCAAATAFTVPTPETLEVR